jgi:HEAT repeat protein
VTLLAILLLFAVAQSVFLLLLFVLVTAHRALATRRQSDTQAADDAMAAPLNAWLAGTAPVDGVAAALASLSERDAIGQLLRTANRIAPEHLHELARAIRGTHWVERILRRERSRFWWRRLTAARVLAIVGVPGDRDRLAALIDDENPAVQAVAANALPRLADASLIGKVLDTLADRSPIVRSAQQRVLLELWRVSAPLLLDRLRRDAPVPRLRSWIALAEAFGTPELLEQVAALAPHPDPLVRLSVAGALRKYFAPATLVLLRRLLADTDWRVRARAAQSLGIVGAAEAVDQLARALDDENWWVRFRAALTLAQLGDPGREVLRRARARADGPAAEMAAMITGLSAGGLVELSEG